MKGIRPSMRSGIVFCLLLLVVFRVPAGAQYIDKREGFLDYRWGSPRGEMTQLGPLRLADNVGSYTRYETEAAFVGGIPVLCCIVEFHHGELSGVALMIRGKTRSRAMFRLLQEQYGEGRQTDPVGCQWFTPATHIFYDEDRVGNSYIYGYSPRLQTASDDVLRADRSCTNSR
jgi:hypothetical protein